MLYRNDYYGTMPRRNRQRRRRINGVSRRNTRNSINSPINNEDMRRIVNLPRQQITYNIDNLLIIHFFNGSSFY
ncbi:hypothetical protein RIR_jg15229.t1 [Rhizophagus irregularis DAOM 181602=DAOM 197198]|nr:hypothetical protein RIR_jg15229.t1 [Rhizophagus irregularis DAOM 181602=DAOM 197198]